MHLKFGHVADYAQPALHRKITIVGIYDTVWVHGAQVGIPFKLPPFYLVARFEAHQTEGRTHDVEIAFADADGKELGRHGGLSITFAEQGSHRPLRGDLIAFMHPVEVPGLGDYSFEFFVDKYRVGSVQFYVREMSI